MRVNNLCYNKNRMDNQNRLFRLERNPKTHAEHKGEVFWQITIPLLGGILVILAAVGVIIFSAIQPMTDVERWADVSLMWLILPSLFFALLFFILLAGLIYATSYLMRVIPHFTLVIQLYFEKARGKISQLANLGVEPILRISAIWAAIRYATERGKKPAQDQ